MHTRVQMDRPLEHGGLSSLTLFGLCAERVLKSPYLLDRASLHLPRHISYFLLYQALESRNQLAVKKVVSKWPHNKICLDFAKIPLCRHYLSSGPECMEPHKYAGYFGSYAHYNSEEIVASLLDAVFHNAQDYSGCCDRGLRSVDLSAIMLRPKQLPLLLNLARGEFPVTHQSDYVSQKEAHIFGISRPFLSNSVHSQGRPLLTLFINVLMDETTKIAIGVLCKLCSEKKWVCVKLKGLNLLGLGTSILTALQSCEDALSSVTHLCLTDASKWWQPHSGLESTLRSLWLRGQHFIPIPLDCREILIDVSELNKNQANKLCIEPRGLRAFCLLLRFRYCYATKEYLDALCTLLAKVSSSLQFFHFYTSKLSSSVMKTLHNCSRLRVLSVYSSSGLQYLTYISKLPKLEFIRWEKESLSVTELALVCQCLPEGFKQLCHFHLRYNSISQEKLSSEETDEEKEILAALAGDENSRDVQIIIGMLTSLRPDVCFRVTQTCGQDEFFKVVSMFDVPSSYTSGIAYNSPSVMK